VGLSQVQSLGTRLAFGEPIAWVHADDAASAARAVAQLQAACTLVDADETGWPDTPCMPNTVYPTI